VREVLEAQGYQIDLLTNRGTTYSVQFHAYTDTPWQRVGTTPTRGIAKFIRTTDNLLIGSILLCDPTQWSDPAIAPFKRAVSGAQVTTRG
jgi:hypothetical protein